MGRTYLDTSIKMNDTNFISKRVPSWHPRRTSSKSATTMIKRENWAKRMTSSTRSLLDDSDVDSQETRHMSLTSSKIRPIFYRGYSLPALLMKNSAPSVVFASANNQYLEEAFSPKNSLPRHRSSDECVDFLPPPTFGKSTITCREDMEVRIEDLRKRISIDLPSVSLFSGELADSSLEHHDT